MANIFYSKEVYKKLKKEVHGKNAIVPVYGMYIAGHHKPPYYTNNGLMINSVGSVNATIESYTMADEYTEDHLMNLIDIDIDSSPYMDNITYYTQATTTLEPDHLMNLIDIDIDSSPYMDNIVSYWSENTNTEDHLMNLIDIDIDSSPYMDNIITYETVYAHSTPEFILNIISVSGGKATIENIRSQ